MLIQADPNAPRALANATFYGKARINGNEVTRPCRMAELAWPITNSWTTIPRPRLVTGVPVSVTESEQAPITIAAREQKWEAAVGEKLAIPLVCTRRSELSGSVLQLKAFGDGFEQLPRLDVSLTADTSQAVLDLEALKTPPGDYVVAFYGTPVTKSPNRPEALRRGGFSQEDHIGSGGRFARYRRSGLVRTDRDSRSSSGGQMNDCFHASSVARCQGPSQFGAVGRRGFLRMGLAGFASLSLPGILPPTGRESQTPTDSGKPSREKTAVILVWQPGGCSHLDTYDPKPEAGSEYRGPFSTISTKVPGLQFSELLPMQARIADKLTVLRSMCQTANGHPSGSMQMLTGDPDTRDKLKPRFPDWMSVTNYLRSRAVRAQTPCRYTRESIRPRNTMVPRIWATPIPRSS